MTLLWLIIEIRTWILSATATVRMTIGADADGGDKEMPNQPAVPMAPKADRETTTRETTTPIMDRVNKKIVMAKNRIIIGTRVFISDCAASENEDDNKIVPVRAM